MTKTIAITGKGGVGKTTIASLIIQRLVAVGKTPVLAVDADSNATLGEALGVEYSGTVGGIREEARATAAALTGVAKQEFLDLQVQAALVEEPGYDMIVMGRPEGPGCYCFANNVLRDVIQRLSTNYEYIVVDSEAGIEHISRRTVLTIDYLFIVSDCTVKGVRTARRIAEMTEEMGTPVRDRGLVLNRVPGGTLTEAMRLAVEESGLRLLAIIPEDGSVAALDAGGIPVSKIPEAAPARLGVNGFVDEILGKTLSAA
ncbi:MAG: AAA family ATPase [Armatimonadota bacterium]